MPRSCTWTRPAGGLSAPPSGVSPFSWGSPGKCRGWLAGASTPGRLHGRWTPSSSSGFWNTPLHPPPFLLLSSQRMLSLLPPSLKGPWVTLSHRAVSCHQSLGPVSTYLFERQSERARDRPCTGSLPRCLLITQNWAKLKPAAPYGFPTWVAGIPKALGPWVVACCSNLRLSARGWRDGAKRPLKPAATTLARCVCVV